MELIEGTDLSVIIARGPMPLTDALPIAKQIADALEAPHETGNVHRDVKPDHAETIRDIDHEIPAARLGYGARRRPGCLAALSRPPGAAPCWAASARPPSDYLHLTSASIGFSRQRLRPVSTIDADVISFSDRVPHPTMASLNSVLTMSSTRSTPCWPNADSPQMYGTTNPDGAGAERQRFEDISPAAHPTIHEYGNPPRDGLNDFRQALDRGAPALGRAAAMVGHDNPVCAVLHREDGIFAGLESLDHDFHARDALETLDEVPGERR